MRRRKGCRFRRVPRLGGRSLLRVRVGFVWVQVEHMGEKVVLARPGLLGQQGVPRRPGEPRESVAAWWPSPFCPPGGPPGQWLQ